MRKNAVRELGRDHQAPARRFVLGATSNRHSALLMGRIAAARASRKLQASRCASRTRSARRCERLHAAACLCPHTDRQLSALALDVGGSVVPALVAWLTLVHVPPGSADSG